MKKGISRLIITLIIIATLFAGSASMVFASTPLRGRVVVAGSSALLPLTLRASKEFKLLNPNVVISASASSSIAGPQSVTRGSAQNGACDWDATKAQGGFKAFSGLVAYKVSITPFATIVNTNVSVSSLTRTQLQGIFSGSITNWKQVGGPNAQIIVVNRASGSGTRVNYQQKALGGRAFMSSGTHYKEVKSSGDMYTAVSTTPNSIGYIDLVYVKGNVKALKYNGVAPTSTNIINKTYPIWGYGYFLTKGQATGTTKAFIDYIRSVKFQQGSLKNMKFIPVSSVR